MDDMMVPLTLNSEYYYPAQTSQAAFVTLFSSKRINEIVCDSIRQVDLSELRESLDRC